MVAEVGDGPADDQMYRLTFDGSVADEHGYVVMGGSAETLSSRLDDRYQPNLDLSAAIDVAVQVLASDNGSSDEPRHLTQASLEVAVLDRTRTQARKFKRLSRDALADLVTGSSG